MNRAERRKIMMQYRKQGVTKTVAKTIVNENYRDPVFEEGQKCKLNYEFIIRHSQYKKQRDDFKEWIEAHANDTLTVDKIRNKGKEVTFVEDTNIPQFWHHTETLIPIISATIKMNDGTEKVVSLDGVTSANDPELNNKINEAMKEV